MQPLQSISIIGGGSWATALVKIFSESGIVVHWYVRSQEHVDFLQANGRNPNYLGFVQLNLDFIKPTCDIDKAIASSADILFAVPSAYLDATVEEMEEDSMQQKKMYVSIKGIVSGEFLIPSVFLSNRFNISVNGITVLAGPCHAEEIAMDKKTFLTVAGKDEVVVNRLKDAVRSHYINVVVNHDPIGVEYAAILKNVIGIASGMAKGLNYGDNFLAVIISNAMREIKNFLADIDDFDRDLFDSAYFGDLLVTAYSEFSRNRTFGNMIGRGYSVPIAESRMNMIAEGFPAVKGMYQAAMQHGTNMPVLSTVHRILYQHASPYIEFKLLETYLK